MVHLPVQGEVHGQGLMVSVQLVFVRGHGLDVQVAVGLFRGWWMCRWGGCAWIVGSGVCTLAVVLCSLWYTCVDVMCCRQM